MTLKSSKTKKQVSKPEEPFRLWAVYEDVAICHITVPGAPYLSTSLRYSLEDYEQIMKAELHPQKKSTKK